MKAGSGYIKDGGPVGTSNAHPGGAVSGRVHRCGAVGYVGDWAGHCLTKHSCFVSHPCLKNPTRCGPPVLAFQEQSKEIVVPEDGSGVRVDFILPSL
mmetsp:Transcript_30725/g.86859  ORF Transcript_30725/g.86859 Transcript_30725/m.86859 type:complete len:97 (-) Transcript_30725:172-462(-)